MGCDIHLHTEIKLRGTWHHYSAPDITRFYAMFHAMGNVYRGPDNVPVIAMPKGLPNDLSAVTQFILDEFWLGDAHTHSWFNFEEIQKLFAWLDLKEDRWDKNSTQREFGYLFDNGWYSESSWKTLGIEDVRWVFWFDN